jgi:flagellar assembly protein FliH
MTTRIHRFDFNALRDFRGPIVANTAHEVEVSEIYVPPPPPVFSEQDMEAARMAAKKEGYSEGFLAGKQEAKKESDYTTEEANAVILSMAPIIEGLKARYEQMLIEESKHLSKLTLSVARKVAGESINERGTEVICATIERCIPVIFSKPRLIVELNPAVFDRTLERIETLLRDSGFEGEIQFKSNPNMGASDVNLDWATGQVNHSAQALWNEIEALIERLPLELTFKETLTTTHQPPIGD